MKLSMQVELGNLVDLLEDTKKDVRRQGTDSGEDQFYIQNPQFKQDEGAISKPIMKVKSETPTPKKVKLKWGRNY